MPKFTRSEDFEKCSNSVEVEIFERSSNSVEEEETGRKKEAASIL